MPHKWGAESFRLTLEGNCPGTCPRCEYELNLLSRFMRENGKTELKISDELARRIEEMWQNTIEDASQSNDAEIMPENGEIENFPIYGEMQEPPREVYKKVFFKECAVAGLSFHIKGNDEVWDELEEGTHIALVRQRDNRYDRNAVAVALADDYDGDPDDFDFDFILGYLPRKPRACGDSPRPATHALARRRCLCEDGKALERARVCYFPLGRIPLG